MKNKKPALSLDSFLGNTRVLGILKRAIEKDRLPHAMIFSGPAGVGKCTLALLIAQYVNCLSPGENGACGRCSACSRISAVIESRYLKCDKEKEGSYCGVCSSCITLSKRHPDIWLIEPQKTTISIDQVRDMINEIAFQPLEARYRVVILDPSEQMRAEAHNSLLKTLEEPASRTIIFLITTNHHMLLETIRSRCRLLQFGQIPQDQIERYLLEVKGLPADEARLAAALSGGSLAAALSLDTAEVRDIRKQALEFIVLLLKSGSFVDVSALATEVTKDKKLFQTWLDSVTALLQDVYYAGIDPQRIGQRDLSTQLEELAQSAPRQKVVTAIDEFKKLRASLHLNVNRQLALESIFVGLAK